MKYNADIVDSSISPPSNFLEVWDKLFPDSRNNGMTKQQWSQLTHEIGGSKFYNCRCDEIGYLAWNNNNHNFKFNVSRIGRYREFGFGLEFYTTPLKCFDFWLNNDILWKDRYLNDLNELSVLTLHKRIEDLNKLEIIELIVYRNLGYNRSRDTVVFKKAVDYLADRLRSN